MRHAYLITANTNWQLLELCLQTLDRAENAFFLLIDGKVKTPLSELIKVKLSESQLIEVPRIEINWGGYSQIQAELNLLQAAIIGKYDYYHFLQGSDFPIKSPAKIDAFFRENKGNEFVQFSPNGYEFAKWKCCYYHILIENRFYRKSKILKAINHGSVFVQKKLNLTRKQPKLFHGSALFSITHGCALYVLESQEKIKRMFSKTCAADEVFLQTIIMQSPFRNSIYHFEKQDGHARYIDWVHRDGNSPKTLRLSDFQMLIELPEQYCFARKLTDAELDLALKIVGTFENNKVQLDD